MTIKTEDVKFEEEPEQPQKQEQEQPQEQPNTETPMTEEQKVEAEMAGLARTIKLNKLRKEAKELTTCQDCEAVQKATKDAANELAEQQADFANKLEALTTANLDLERQKAELKQQAQAIRAERKALEDFQAKFEDSGSEWRRKQVKMELEAIWDELRAVGCRQENTEGLRHLRRLERLWLGQEVKL